MAGTHPKAVRAGALLLSGEAETGRQARAAVGYADPRNGRPKTTELVKAALEAGFGGSKMQRLRRKSEKAVEEILDDPMDRNRGAVAVSVLKIAADLGEIDDPAIGNGKQKWRRLLDRYMLRCLLMGATNPAKAIGLAALAAQRLGAARYETFACVHGDLLQDRAPVNSEKPMIDAEIVYETHPYTGESDESES